MDVYKAGQKGYRKRMKRRKDRRVFSRTSSSTRKENINPAPMRLGTRL